MWASPNPGSLIFSRRCGGCMSCLAIPLLDPLHGTTERRSISTTVAYCNAQSRHHRAGDWPNTYKHSAWNRNPICRVSLSSRSFSGAVTERRIARINDEACRAAGARTLGGASFFLSPTRLAMYDDDAPPPHGAVTISTVSRVRASSPPFAH